MTLKRLIVLICYSLFLLSCDGGDESSSVNRYYLDMTWLGNGADDSALVILCGHLAAAPINLELTLRSPEQTQPEGITGHISRMRMSFFRNDGSTDIPSTFDQDFDFFIPGNNTVFITTEIPLAIIAEYCSRVRPMVRHPLDEAWSEGGWGLMHGWLVIQAWGTIDELSEPFLGETRLPIQFLE